MNRFKVTEKAMRPASPERKCFYCMAPIGKNHWSNCVLVKKKVKVRVTVEYKIDAPSHWTSEDVKRHRNEGSWCGDNIVEELETERLRLNKCHDCFCDTVKLEVIQHSGKAFLDED